MHNQILFIKPFYVIYSAAIFFLLQGIQNTHFYNSYIFDIIFHLVHLFWVISSIGWPILVLRFLNKSKILIYKAEILTYKLCFYCVSIGFLLIGFDQELKFNILPNFIVLILVVLTATVYFYILWSAAKAIVCKETDNKYSFNRITFTFIQFFLLPFFILSLYDRVIKINKTMENNDIEVD